MALEPYFETGALRLYHGDAYAVMASLPERSCHMLITSPPYWGLRRYSGHEGEQVRTFEDGWTGQYGSEPTPQMWAEHTAEWLRVARRVLRDDAPAWVNLGDAYSSQGGHKPNSDAIVTVGHRYQGKANLDEGLRKTTAQKAPAGFKPLDLIWQAALLYPLLLRDGWYMRSVVIWDKPAPMPESVSGWEWRRCRVKVGNKAVPIPNKQQGAIGSSSQRLALYRDNEEQSTTMWVDCPGCPKCAPTDGWVLRRGSWRPTSSHEYILMLAKNERYFADQEAVREEAHDWGTRDRSNYRDRTDDPLLKHHGFTNGNNAATGHNPRSVWRIGPEPSKEKHYAAFPSELPERCIKVATSEHGVCPACGAPWARMIEKPFSGRWHDHEAGPTVYGKRQDGQGPPTDYEKPKTVGWRKTCSCETEERIPATVLDPFFGTGSTGRAALRLGRRCIGIDIAQDYADIAAKQLRQDLLV